MPLVQWKLALRDVASFLDVLEKNNQYIVSETATPSDDFDVEPAANEEGKKEITGSVASLVERLADELTSHLLAIDPHSTEYISRLRDETSLYTLIVRAQLYYERITKNEEFATAKGNQLARIVLKRLDSIYFKPSRLVIGGETRTWESIPARVDSRIYQKYSTASKISDVEYTNGLMDSLCSILYKQENSIYRKKAVLYHIYYYAFNDQYYKARDMLLLSHLQSTIHTADPQLQVLFNRALVQLGLSAFRSGLLADAQQSLQEIATSPRQRELLGQGVQRFQSQQTQADKQRLLPFHMHINLELLECSFYTASMLIEIPQIAANPELAAKKRQTSPKAFKRVLEYHERQVFDGPPENARDHIMLAARALSKFDWKKASELINAIKIWDLFTRSTELKQLLKEKLQVEALRTYIFKNKSFYVKCSIANLSTQFELSEDKVRSILAKMIHSDEVNALIDLSANQLVFVQDDPSKPTKLQELVVTLSDKCSQIIERNERLSLGGYQIQMDAKKLPGKKQAAK
ncbi:unnamed protein product [Ambrosiozyma monospora]|uniref:Unnamed protein product n=1 Tax=Ambrosiozyma monospora TaxID=43982 RepID=A0ACB5T6H2_AMBMO|nr:unnamed protein product [Ambrosiozyma monospora]